MASMWRKWHPRVPEVVREDLELLVLSYLLALVVWSRLSQRALQDWLSGEKETRRSEVGCTMAPESLAPSV